MSASLSDVSRRLSTDAFLRWLENRAEPARWELIDGEPIRSQGARDGSPRRAEAQHAKALRDGLRAAALPCRAFGDGRGVDGPALLQPDASVTCAENIDPGAIEVLDPMVVVEVVSRAAGGATRRSCWSTNSACPSVRHYLLIETRRRQVLHHRRGIASELVTRFPPTGRFRLDPPGIDLEIEALYAGTAVV